MKTILNVINASLAIALVAMIMLIAAVPARADTALVLTASWAADQHFVTNTTSAKWIYAITLNGAFTGTNQCEIAVNNGFGYYILESESTTTNTLQHRGCPSLKWEAGGIIRFTVTRAGSTTNFHEIILDNAK